jgi:hypothetical protein
MESRDCRQDQEAALRAGFHPLCSIPANISIRSSAGRRNLRNLKPFNQRTVDSTCAETLEMPTLSNGLLRTALALKLSQIKLATRSYLRDRTGQATGTVSAYAVAAGLYAAAGVFVIAACLVGTTALFRWIELNYGLFQAFGVIGALLLVAAGICVVVALFSLKRSPPQFPSLASRLRVAIKHNPIHASQTQIAEDTASAVRSPTLEKVRIRRGARLQRDDLQISASLILIATLLCWAAARRWQQARRIQPKTAAPSHR